MPPTQFSSWSTDTWIAFVTLCTTILGILISAVWKSVKWLRNRSAKLKAELSIHAVSDPATHICIGNGVEVRLVHRGGKPIKIKDVYLRVKDVDVSSINKAWSGGLGMKAPSDLAENRTWLGVRLYRMKTDNIFIRRDLDMAVDFDSRHEEHYFTAVPITPDGLNQLFWIVPPKRLN